MARATVWQGTNSPDMQDGGLLNIMILGKDFKQATTLGQSEYVTENPCSC